MRGAALRNAGGPKSPVVTLLTNSREGGGRSVVLVPHVDRRAVLGIDFAQ